MRKLVRFSLLVLLIACQEDVPAVDETAVPPTITAITAVPSPIPTDLPAPAVVETTPEVTAVPPTLTSAPVAPNSISSIIAQVEVLSAQFELTVPYQTGWLYRREELYAPPQPGVTHATYRGLADDWVSEVWTEVSPENTIARQVLLVYDTEGGLWERSAIVGNNNVRVLPEKTVDGRVNTLDSPLLYRSPHQDLITILREMETASMNQHTVAAWEEDGRYHIQIDTLYQTPVPAADNTTGQSLNGAKMYFALDTHTGELLQQQYWTVNGAGEETLRQEVNGLETAVVTELPALAAQTLSDANTLLVQTQSP